MFQTLFNSAEGLACSSPELSRYWLERYIIDLLLAAAASNILHIEFTFLLMDYNCTSVLLASLTLIYLFILLYY